MGRQAQRLGCQQKVMRYHRKDRGNGRAGWGRVTALVILLLVATWSLSACDRDYERDELGAARARWGQKAPRSDSMLYARHCYCFWCSQVLITVQDGSVVAADYWPSGLSAPEADTRCARVSVEQIFNEIPRWQRASRIVGAHLTSARHLPRDSYDLSF